MAKTFLQKLDIRDIKKSLGAHMSVSADEMMSLPGVTLRGPVHVDLRLTNAGSRVLLGGQLRVILELTCARCAQLYQSTETVDVQEEFLPVDSPELPSGPDLHPEELNVFVYEEDRIDILDVIRQNVIAALPIQPLCREDCAGLCTVCGNNRNESPCTCTQKTVDPRWDGLKKFIKQDT